MKNLLIKLSGLIALIFASSCLYADEFDIQIMYTTGALNAEGGSNAMMARILSDIGFANQVLANSNIDSYFHLVHIEHVPQFDYYDSTTCDSSMGIPSSAYGHGQRELFGSDLCHAYTSCTSSSVAGVSDVSGPSSASVISASAMTFTHELGHSLGCGHDRDNMSNWNNREYEYSHGYRFYGNDSVQYRTVMAYPPGLWIPYFSSPSLYYEGQPMGVLGGDPNGADSRLTIMNYGDTSEAREPEYLWHEALALPNWGRTIFWLGEFTVEDWDTGYIVHDDLGTLYVDSLSTLQSLWMYSYDLSSWIYTQDSWFRTAYVVSIDDYIDWEI